ncbi:hypothetical protein ACS0TY_032096 [Phlomoides rotata]
MKLFSISSQQNWRTYSFYQKIRTQTYRTKPTRTRFPRNDSVSEPLLRRILPLGDPNKSIVPELDKWIEEGNSAKKWEIHGAINKLMTTRRFRHALEVSLWMTNTKRLPIAPFDIGVRLKLILKNFGMEQAESYFYKIPENLRTYQVYLALLNCYAVAKSVDKAESIMQKARDLGYASKPIWYNLMMNLYCQVANKEKLAAMLIEMEEKGIPYDHFTYSVCLSACVMAYDADGMDKVVRIMETNSMGMVHWRTWCIAAKGYLRIGSGDEAMEITKKLEKQLKETSNNYVFFVFLINLYAEAGKKDELFRVWKIYKQKGKVVNKVYISMMRSLLKFDDIEGMEKIIEEWESGALHFDFRVPNFLIDAYCTDGHLEKAEALLTKVTSRGGNPNVLTWCHLAGGYLRKNQVPEAARCLRKAIAVCPRYFMSQKDYLITCSKHLEKEGDGMEKAVELIKRIRMKGISKKAFSDEFPSLTEDGELQSCGENQISESILVSEDDEFVDDQEEFCSRVIDKQM